jgi:hypothetical protein
MARIRFVTLCAKSARPSAVQSPHNAIAARMSPKFRATRTGAFARREDSKGLNVITMTSQAHFAAGSA